MRDFIYYAPTEVVFGVASEEKTGKLVKQCGGTNVLVHYGGQSAERSGLLGKICRALEAEACLPVAAILTIPAAGSEMSNSTVITNEDGDLKKGYSNDLCRCKFAVMNPERTFTLPNYQTACGVTDIMMHTMERYFSHDDDMTVTDAVAEGYSSYRERQCF